MSKSFSKGDSARPTEMPDLNCVVDEDVDDRSGKYLVVRCYLEGRPKIPVYFRSGDLERTRRIVVRGPELSPTGYGGYSG